MDSSKLVRISIRTNLKFLLPFVKTAFPRNEVIKVDPSRCWKHLLRSYEIPVQDKHIINSGNGMVSGISTQIYHHIRKIRHSGKRRKNRTYIVRVGIDSSKKVYGVQKTIPAPLKRKLKQRKLMDRRRLTSGGMFFKRAENNYVAKKFKLVAPEKIAKLKAKWKVPETPDIPNIQRVEPRQTPIAEFDPLGPSSLAKDNIPIQKGLLEKLAQSLVNNSGNSKVATENRLSLNTVGEYSSSSVSVEYRIERCDMTKFKDNSTTSNDAKSAVIKSLMTLSNSDFWRMKREFKESKKNGKFMSIMQHMRGMTHFITVALDGKNFATSNLDVKKTVVESIAETHNNSMLRRMKKHFDDIKREYIWYQITSYVPTIVNMLELILDDENFAA